MTEQPTALALTTGWTDSPVTLMNAGNAAMFNNASGTLNTNCTNTSNTLWYGYSWGNYWYPYYVPIFEHKDRRPIRLTMGEVERLRVAAKKDKELKAVLEKFTDHIEVMVDFGSSP